jgi:hypothetical protein
MDTRKIVDYAINDDAKEMRESLYASIYDRVTSAFEAKKQEIAHGLLGLNTEETECGSLGDHEDAEADKKLVKKMVKKSSLKTEEEHKEWMKKKAKKMAKKMVKKHMKEQAAQASA